MKITRITFINQFKLMKIVDYSYLIPSLIMILGIPVLFYLKLSSHETHSLSITIYGSTIETALLAYYIDKNIEKVYGSYEEGKKYLNITIVSPFDPPQNDKLLKQTDKTLLTFCGVQNHLLGLLNDLDMQFEINEYGIYFSELKHGKLLPQANLQTYRVQEQYPFKSLFQYGLSHITAKNIFQQFESHLSQASKSRSYESISSRAIQELSMASSISHLFPNIFEEQSGIKYLSQTIGLDQQYIHDYIMPVVWGSYLDEANSITTMLKLLPLYCMKNKEIGSSLAILIDQNQLYRKIVAKIKYINLNHVYNHHLQQFKLLTEPNDNPNQIQSKHSQLQIQATYLNTFVNQTKQQEQKQASDEKQDGLSYAKLRTNLLFVIEDYEMVNKKEISYYKTIVDGKIKGDEYFQEFFTLYFTYQKQDDTEESEQTTKSSKYIYSASRLCKQNCKNFNKNVYLLISKQKLTEKDLGMFEQHHIIYYKKFWLPKTQLPSTKKFQEIQNVYRIYDTESISDSYEFKLTVFDQLSHVVIRKMQGQ